MKFIKFCSLIGRRLFYFRSFSKYGRASSLTSEVLPNKLWLLIHIPNVFSTKYSKRILETVAPSTSEAVSSGTPKVDQSWGAVHHGRKRVLSPMSLE